VTLGDLDACSSSTANPERSQVRGSQILAALERGMDPSIAEAAPHSLRGSPIGRPQISGMTVEFDPQQPLGERICAVHIHGDPLERDRLYWLAHTDAEPFQDIEILPLEAGQSREAERPTIVREVVEDYLRAHSPVPVPRLDRWRRVTGD